MVHFWVDLPPGVGDALARATMRVEAERLLADARVYGTDRHEDRAPAARRADAFVLVTRRVTAALRRAA